MESQVLNGAFGGGTETGAAPVFSVPGLTEAPPPPLFQTQCRVPVPLTMAPVGAPGVPSPATSMPVLPATSTPAPTAPSPVARVEESRIALPAGLAVEPWQHQRDGYEFGMRSLRQYNAVLLAAQMGVGKTFVATMLALGRGHKFILVVCPLRVIASWQKQLGEYIKGNSIVVGLDDRLTTSKRRDLAAEKIKLARVTGAPFFCLINYDSFWRGDLAEWLLSVRWGAVIYDESHKLKSPGGRASMMAKRLIPVTGDRILATGTPLAHSPLDIFGQFRAAIPFVFGPSYAAFKQRYAKMGGPDKKWITGYQNLDQLEQKMAPFTWRKTKAEALPYLPSETDVEYTTEFQPETYRIYNELFRDMITEVAGQVLTTANAMTKVLRLQQICGGSVPTDDGTHHQVDNAKEKLLEDTLDDLAGQPVVIFCRFRSDIDAAHRACAALGLKSAELSGTRNELVEWQEADDEDPKQPQVLVVQVQSGSVGISLVRASVAIYYSLSSSLVEYDQSRSRIHRPGQKNACTYIYLTVKNTVDQLILAALRSRQEVIEYIMSRVQELANERMKKK